MSDAAVSQLLVSITTLGLALVGVLKVWLLKQDVKDTQDAVKEADQSNRDLTSSVAAKVDATKAAVRSVHADAVAVASEAKEAAAVAADNTNEIKQIVNGERTALLAELAAAKALIAALQKEKIEAERKTASESIQPPPASK